MSLRSITVTLGILGRLILFAIIFYGVVITVFILNPDWGSSSAPTSNPFDFDDSLTTGEAISRFWPKEIIIAILIFLLVEVTWSDWFSGLVKKIRISGNIVIPLLILFHVTVIACYIFTSNITYPTRLGDARLIPVLILTGASQVMLIFLFIVNSNLSRPASSIQFVAHIVILYGMAYVALVSWLNYLHSGEFHIGYKLYMPT